MVAVRPSTLESVRSERQVGSLLLPSLFVIWASLLFLNVLNDIVAQRSDAKVWLLDVDVERSVYTWYSQLLLAGVATLLLDTGAKLLRVDRWAGVHWLLLAGVFGILSADEALSLHELLSLRLAQAFDTSGLLAFAWVAPAGVICLAGLATAMPFLFRLPARVRGLMLVAAATFLGGAIGMEMVGGAIVSSNGEDFQALPYRFAVAVEEGLEGLGVLIFLYSHLLYRRAAGLAGPSWMAAS